MKVKILVIAFLCCMPLMGCDNSIEEQIDKAEETTVIEMEENAEQTQGSVSEAYEKGQEINQELIDKMNNIDWEENYDKAQEYGRKLAEFLNGN